MVKLYKTASVFNTFNLPVSNIHTLYVEESGKLDGIPIIILHGGPGSKSKPKYRKLYNPEKYRIILFDQRGCGKSTPRGEIKENTTWDLVDDIEKIRKHLGIKRWIVAGSSWGSTLALSYAETCPKSVRSLLLQGIFLFRKKDLSWFLDGYELRRIFPDLWEQKQIILKRLNIEPANTDKDLYNILLDGTVLQKQLASLYFENWEGQFYSIRHTIRLANIEDIDENTIDSNLILMHYAVNNGFFKPNQLLANAGKIKHIPTTIIHGRYDMVCPIDQAWELHKTLPKSTLHIISVAGHQSSEPAISKKIVEISDSLSKIVL